MPAAIPAGYAWTSPFAKWGGTLAAVSSLDTAAAVTRAALDRRGYAVDQVDHLVLGWTIPQSEIFYGPSSLASAIGAPTVGGLAVSQACATSVAALESAAASALGGRRDVLAVLTDRTSNAPTMVYPQPNASGGAPQTEHWLLHAFEADPCTGESMLATAEHVAEEAGIDRAELDDLTALRNAQYAARPSTDHVVAVEIPGRRGTLTLADDEGVRLSSTDELAALRPAAPNGRHTFGSQTHPADGAAGALVTAPDRARELSVDGSIAELLGFGSARVASGRMPTAPVPAARAALDAAGLTIDDVDLVGTHNPFAVNDVYFTRQTGFDTAAMNVFGCSLVYGHPQGPTGMRGIAELIEALRARGGGVGLFTGCAAGDQGAAVVLRVTE
ncbi:thiolase family protein [Gordonia phthalatica]|uniref:Probable acetyl-CoA acetyltransferase n=1 Tax=Gordonia phthalatica TaxID=1136941 RepID=A0A0N9NDU0_9ACTN|nr:thiolase family protein [Gordonia phthalatica]ALG85243.1 acetyl-CoA acetyltransferase [Gordonia phthalatica]